MRAKRGKKGSRTRLFTAVVHREDDLWVVLCPEVGTTSQGDNIDDAVANLREATELYLEEFPTPDVGRSLVTTFEVQSVKPNHSPIWHYPILVTAASTIVLAINIVIFARDSNLIIIKER
jgi:predicted RNase H-like HicB family nuclease